MKKSTAILLLLFCALLTKAQKPGDIVVLYDNDVHCAVKGYPVMAGLRDSLERMGCHVAVVSAGDFSFGGPIGAISKGEYIVKLMNATGYQFACLGNHEFDYGMHQLQVLKDNADATYLCLNLRTTDNNRQLFIGSASLSLGGKQFYFIGITTPSTLNTSSPTTFQDNQGNIKYHFSEKDLATIVQNSIDSARKQDVDYIVLLTHLGDAPGPTSSRYIIEHTHGIDLVIDGHDHHVLPFDRCSNDRNQTVTLSSTGTQFQYIGMATIGDNGTFHTRLLSVDSLAQAGCISQSVTDTLNAINHELEMRGSQIVAHCLVRQIAEENDIRVCRLRETNLGNLVADAYRETMKTDIALVNAGGLRSNIDTGAITHNMLYAVSPFDNEIVSISALGQDIINALETGAREYPSAEGCFLQVSGLSFTINASTPSSVRLADNGRLRSIDGPRRVKKVKVNGRKINPKRRYTIAGPSYILLDGGNGFNFPSAQLIATSPLSDLQMLEEYIQSHLQSIISYPTVTVPSRIIFSR